MQDTSSLRLAFDMLGFNGNDNDNAHCDIRQLVCLLETATPLLFLMPLDLLTISTFSKAIAM